MANIIIEGAIRVASSLAGKQGARKAPGAMLAAILMGVATPASAQVCQGPFTAQLTEHAAANRVTTTSSSDCSNCFFGICGFPSGCDTSTTSYTAVGSGEDLGTDGSATVTLYESPAGTFSTAPCNMCDAQESSCGDGVDNDCDGDTDCDDSECSNAPACTPTLLRLPLAPPAFTSNDGVDLDLLTVGPPSTQTWNAYASVPLPPGATPVEVSCRISSGSGMGGSLRLVTQDLTTGIADMATLPGTNLATPANTTQIFTEAADHVLQVDENTVTSVVITLSSSGQSVPRIAGCTVGYEP